MRFAAAQISHETNVFSSVKTDLAAFERSGLRYGTAICERERDTNSTFGGFIEAASDFGFELVPLLSVWATPSGIVTSGAITALLAELESGLKSAGAIDGVLLGLHGAMVSEIDDDGDALILETVRVIVGKSIPTVATLDLHANISPRMVDAATVLIGYDTYPHVDMAERAIEAASLLVRIVRGEINPVMALVKPPMAPTSQNMPTHREPMRSLIARAHEMESQPGVLNVTVAGGFPPSDSADTGAGILVTTDGDRALGARLANELAVEMWYVRDQFLGGVTPFAEAERIVSSLPERVEKPLLLVDIGDNPWGGSPGDSAELLRFLIEERVVGAALAIIVDPAAVQACISAGVGSFLELTLGGKTDDLHGSPLPVRARVRAITDGRYVNIGPMMAGLTVDLGTTAVLLVGDPAIEVLVTSKAETPIDLNVFRSHGIDPTKRSVIALKGKGHFRAAFEPIADQVVLVEGPGISGSDFRRLPFRKITRPIWPLDEDCSFA